MLQHILDSGEDHEDRTGVGTLSVFGYQLRHKMADGFPLMTTKFVSFSNVAKELLWFLSGSVYEPDLSGRGCKIWAPWATYEECKKFGRRKGDMGPIYGRLWRAFGSFTRDVVQSERAHPSNYSGSDPQAESPEFLKSLPEFKDFKCNTGYLGRPYECEKKLPEHVHKRLVRVWEEMLENCYGDGFSVFKDFNVRVCKRWRNRSVFIRDALLLPYFTFLTGEPELYTLDPFHMGADWYSPETCIWLPNWMHHQYRMVRPLQSSNDPQVSQFGTPVDQIARLVEGLVNSPHSRRHLVTAWNPQTAENVTLPACHSMFQVKVHDDDSLSLHMYQRSADAPIGVPYNIASYGLLLEMLCAVTNRKARDLIISYGDLHIYRNQVDGVKEQLDRDPYPFPEFKISLPDGNTVLEKLLLIEPRHLHLSGYKSWPAINMPVAV